MFELTKEEFDNLRRHFGASRWGGTRYLPMVFTEQGVAMLSSVLKSKRAIQVNILIIKTFVKLRRMISSHKEILETIGEMEKKYDRQFKIVFDTLRDIVIPQTKSKNKIGFIKHDDKK